MKLDAVTFPQTVQVGHDHRKTWQRETHQVDLDLDGHVVIIRKSGCKTVIAGVANLMHGVVADKQK